jgi:hypothetical protein
MQIRRPEPLTRATFNRGLAYLEAAKQENFAPETLNVWFDQMTRLCWTETRFRERVVAVLHAPTYGKISFDMFLSAEMIPQAKPQKKCAIHGEAIVDGHCPSCWAANVVPMPAYVMEEIKKLEEQMDASEKK